MSAFKYRMPAEWEPREATWLSWPVNRRTWPGGLLEEVQVIYLGMIKALLPGEKVHLLVPDEKTAKSVTRRLGMKKKSTGCLIFHYVKTAGPWIRDYGPVFLIPHPSSLIPRKAFTKWIFNAWGGKYLDHLRDNGVVDKLEALRGYKRFDAGMILEGGSIDVNGRGTLVTTEQCLLNPNRNRRLSRRQIEKRLKACLGIRKIIWLKKGIQGDDTDGHVDDMTRFVGPRTILTALEKDPADSNYKNLYENFKILKSQVDQDQKKFRVVGLPMPGVVKIQRRRVGSHRLPASYANFYIGQKTVLVPVYRHRNDKVALKIIRGLFPDRKIVGIDCTALVYGRGSIHCVTQQQPA